MVIFNIFFSHSTIFHEASTKAGPAFSTLEASVTVTFNSLEMISLTIEFHLEQ